MKIAAVDGTNVIMRYAFAMCTDPRNPSDDDRLHALRSVTLAIREFAYFAGSSHAIVAVDSPAETWRKKIFAEYKGHREKLEGVWSTEEWTAQLKEYLSEKGWLVLEAPGFEADDILATLAERAVTKGRSIAILSSDSDLLQLLHDQVECWQFGRNPEAKFVRRRGDWVCDRFGLEHANQLVAYKALVGEGGDNLPGVKGIGPVKAKAILDQTDLCHCEAIEGILPEEQRGSFRLAFDLATLRRDVPLDPILPSACKVPAP